MGFGTMVIGQRETDSGTQTKQLVGMDRSLPILAIQALGDR